MICFLAQVMSDREFLTLASIASFHVVVVTSAFLESCVVKVKSQFPDLEALWKKNCENLI